jgi:hypothetical protein
VWFSSEHFPTTIHKELHITIKENNPCFYIDTFEGINEFNIDYFNVNKVGTNSQWLKKEYMWKDEIDTNRILPFTAIAEKNQCLLYGIKNTISSVPSKTLQTNVLYQIKIQGTRKNIPKSGGYIDLKDGDRILLHSIFYLVKNQKTSETKIIIPSQTQVVEWVKKMDEQNQSIEITKDKK